MNATRCPRCGHDHGGAACRLIPAHGKDHAMTDLRALLGDRYDDVIERALAAADTPWHGYQVTRGNVDERDVSTALAAVLPDLLAAAWDEGHDAGWDASGAESDLTDTPNPYRSTLAYRENQLAAELGEADA